MQEAVTVMTHSSSAWAATTECHRPGSVWTTEINISEFWRLAIQDQTASKSGSGNNPLLRYRLLLTLHCIVTWWKAGPSTLWGAFNKGTNPFHKSFTLMTSQVPFLLICRVRISMQGFQQDTNILCIPDALVSTQMLLGADVLISEDGSRDCSVLPSSLP